jgi:hypothetical protein
VNPDFYCAHGQNPKACLKCFHAPKPKAAAAPMVPSGPVSPMQARANAILAATRTGAPAPAPPAANAMMNAVTQVPPTQSVPLPHVQRPKTIKSLDDAPKVQSTPPTAFSYDSGTAPIPSGDQLWEPPPRVGREAKGVIDLLPRHPNPNGK